MSSYQHEQRYRKTLKFVEKHLSKGSSVLDLGTPNRLSGLLYESGYNIQNTRGEDLDLEYGAYTSSAYDAVTAFEIFEHMLAPFNILKGLKAKKLIASVPLKLWFAKAYWNEKDPWDRHYHEFEKRQFDFLLEKTGWSIIDSECWVSYERFKPGIRPFLRRFTPRYYIVCCTR